MSWFADLTRSAVGKKAVMAVTGIILFGFVFVHMVGNLKVYTGAEHMNAYGDFLRQVGAPALPPNGLLWLARLVLLASVGLHIWAAWSLTRMAKAARPSRYEHKEKNHTNYASRTMRWGGVIVLLFIIYHILHFTTGTVLPGFEAHRPYENLVRGFTGTLGTISAVFYIVANIALGMHLYHGIWSIFQSLGWSHPRFNPWRSWLAHGFAWLITLGNISFPLAVMTGLVR
ncbi:MAG TPA: succinate dehydrogenase cytochrome b subunit [Thermoanaerobaculia bacterium]|nr:succinate dehydrogenase cytochrome b subunit [Thermoanaerobaculia bacterium]